MSTDLSILVFGLCQKTIIKMQERQLIKNLGEFDVEKFIKIRHEVESMCNQMDKT
jgi:hypothetical protein